MSRNIKVHFRDGTTQEFLHRGRAGGSYTKKIRYEGNFVIITDEYDKSTAFPMDIIQRVDTTDDGYGF